MEELPPNFLNTIFERRNIIIARECPGCVSDLPIGDPDHLCNHIALKAIITANYRAVLEIGDENHFTYTILIKAFLFLHDVINRVDEAIFQEDAEDSDYDDSDYEESDDEGYFSSFSS